MLNLLIICSADQRMETAEVCQLITIINTVALSLKDSIEEASLMKKCYVIALWEM